MIKSVLDEKNVVIASALEALILLKTASFSFNLTILGV